ncbi:MAG: hypothetical protein KUG77_23715 [Nannocystaceae bacterium]|nr:hypothetical protein [Nannocystaceae bacterium]
MPKAHRYEVSIVVPLAAEPVWHILSREYGRVQDYADQIVASRYAEGHSAGGEGCERVCDLNPKGTSFLREQMVNVDDERMQYTNVLTDAKGAPLVPGVSRTIFGVRRLGESSSTLWADSTVQTRPAFLATLLKGVFRKSMRDYLLSVSHHLCTGEVVGRKHIKAIRAAYAAQQAVA